MLVNDGFVGLLRGNGLTNAKALWAARGEDVKKQRADRGTEKVCLASPDGEGQVITYIKRYRPVGLREHLKNLFSLRPLIFDGAFHEWNALFAFHAAGLHTMLPIAVAKTSEGSCLMTLGIIDYVRLSDLARDLFADRAAHRDRIRALLRKTARLAAKVHSHGFAHQDFYLVHIFVKEAEQDRLYLIDLQRLIYQKKLSRRWRVKDLAQLLYSSEAYLTATDKMYFWKHYATAETRHDRTLIRAILEKAAWIKRRAGANRN